MPATAMYVTGLDYDTGKPITVARNAGERYRQRQALAPNQRTGSAGAGQRKPAWPKKPLAVMATDDEEDAPNW
jgi:hypothetical protein